MWSRFVFPVVGSHNDYDELGAPFIRHHTGDPHQAASSDLNTHSARHAFITKIQLKRAYTQRQCHLGFFGLPSKRDLNPAWIKPQTRTNVVQSESIQLSECAPMDSKRHPCALTVAGRSLSLLLLLFGCATSNRRSSPESQWKLFHGLFISRFVAHKHSRRRIQQQFEQLGVQFEAGLLHSLRRTSVSRRRRHLRLYFFHFAISPLFCGWNQGHLQVTAILVPGAQDVHVMTSTCPCIAHCALVPQIQGTPQEVQLSTPPISQRPKKWSSVDQEQLD